MMNLINAIPDHIGWIIVGAMGMLALEMLGLLIRTVVDMVRDHMMDYDEEVEEC